jgi:FtsH-binding integral membrane protein
LEPIFKGNDKMRYIAGCMTDVIIYSLYLVYDTQLMIGKFDNEYSVDDYVFAAINIYLDIINLFIYILRLVAIIKGE